MISGGCLRSCRRGRCCSGVRAMNDANLLVFGCAVSFIALAGAYVFIRERFTEGQRQPEPVESRLRDLKGET